MRLFKIITLCAALLISAPAFAATYKIDPDHSSVGFKIRHLAISTVNGSFTKFDGSFSYDPANVKSSATEATVTVGSINTQQEKRDGHLKSPDFFDAEKFPVMKFKSTGIADAAKDGFKVNGELTIRDVTKPVTLDVTVGGLGKDPMGKERAAFSATAKINRKDFGLTWNKVLEAGALVVGDEVTIVIEVEGVKI